MKYFVTFLFALVTFSSNVRAEEPLRLNCIIPVIGGLYWDHYKFQDASQPSGVVEFIETQSPQDTNGEVHSFSFTATNLTERCTSHCHSIEVSYAPLHQYFCRLDIDLNEARNGEDIKVYSGCRFANEKYKLAQFVRAKCTRY